MGQRIIAAAWTAAWGISGGVLIAVLGPDVDEHARIRTFVLSCVCMLAGLAAAERIANGNLLNEADDDAEIDDSGAEVRDA
jgi:hypothetical protein